MPESQPPPKSKTVVGNLVRDPEAKLVDTKVVVEMSVAYNPERYNPDTRRHERTGPTEYYEVSAWGALGQSCARSLRKGDRVIVEGLLRESTFERQDGSEGVSRAVTAYEVGYSLTFASLERGGPENPGITPSAGSGPSLA